jgi:hypothetical protein
MMIAGLPRGRERRQQRNFGGTAEALRTAEVAEKYPKGGTAVTSVIGLA